MTVSVQPPAATVPTPGGGSFEWHTFGSDVEIALPRRHRADPETDRDGGGPRDVRARPGLGDVEMHAAIWRWRQFDRALARLELESEGDLHDARARRSLEAESQRGGSRLLAEGGIRRLHLDGRHFAGRRDLEGALGGAGWRSDDGGGGVDDDADRTAGRHRPRRATA